MSWRQSSLYELASFGTNSVGFLFQLIFKSFEGAARGFDAKDLSILHHKISLKRDVETFENKTS
jgi:hypothetical protein